MIRPSLAILSCLAGVALATLPLPACATLDASRFSDMERVGFAFAQLTDTHPDLQDWIMTGEAYQNAAPDDRTRLVQSELARLHDGMTDYDGKVDLIHTVAKVTVTWTPTDAKTPGAHSITLSFAPPGAIFVYHLGTQRIDVVAEQVDNPVAFRLPEDDYQAFVAASGNGGATTAVLELYLQPEAADTVPVVVQGEKTLPMVTRVAHLALWTPDHQQILWSFDAPWFSGSERRQILDLYNR